jgi:Schlafen, AlbA_2
LVSWEKLLDGQSVVPGYSDQIQLDRVGGYSTFGRYPCWQGVLPEVYTDSPPFMTPRGPFLSPESGIFKHTIGGLAAAWTGMPGYEGDVQPRHQMYSVIHDPRAHFSDGRHSGLQIEIEVTALPTLQGDLYCGVSAKDFNGVPYSLFAPVKESRAIFTLPTQCREIEALLINGEGYWFDRLIENEYFCNTPFSLLGLFHRSKDAKSQDLLQALARGEGEYIEFKEWLPPEREHSKSYELLKTACAFANTGGGVLYIGVTDELEICGVSRELHRWKPKMKSEELRALYATEISRLIDQGVSPPIRISVEWVSHAGFHVLRVDIPASVVPNHYIVESNHTFVRRGANCKLATPQDIQALANSSRSFGRL